AVVKVVQRLDPGAIAVELEPILARVPDRDREHAVDPIDEALAPLEIGIEDDLGVRFGPKCPAEPLELAPDAAPAVNLAVEDEPAPVRPEHRLPGRVAEIDDRQALETDLDRPVELQPARVGTA